MLNIVCTTIEGYYVVKQPLNKKKVFYTFLFNGKWVDFPIGKLTLLCDTNKEYNSLFVSQSQSGKVMG